MGFFSGLLFCSVDLYVCFISQCHIVLMTMGGFAESTWRSRRKVAFNAREPEAFVRSPGEGEEAQKSSPPEPGQKTSS